jgi:Zn-dependent hydrolases, including glyoxylases
MVCGLMVTMATWAAELPGPKMTPVQVGPHSYYVRGASGPATHDNRGFMSNAGFVITSDGVVVFDSLGTPALGEELIAAIRHLTRQPIRRVIVSHYHADHIYGLQAFRKLGAQIWAQRRGQEYLAAKDAQDRLAQRREALSPWVDEHTQLVPADRWLDGDSEFEMGGLHFLLRYVGPAHAPDDLAMYVVEDRVLYAGDVAVRGRIPYIGAKADSRSWIKSLDKLLALKPRVLVPGHGKVTDHPVRDLAFTRDYIATLRKTMGAAARELEPFADAYRKVDWSRWSGEPAFDESNRSNAYNVYLQMEREVLMSQ